MTRPYADEFLGPITDRQCAEDMEQVNNRLRKRIKEMKSDCTVYNRLIEIQAMRIDALTQVDVALSTEVADLDAENFRLFRRVKRSVRRAQRVAKSLEGL